MTTRNRPGRQTSGTAPQAREASGKHQGLYRPDNDQRIEQRLDKVGLEDQGDAIEDDLRDRRSSGTPSDREQRTRQDRSDLRR